MKSTNFLIILCFVLSLASCKNHPKDERIVRRNPVLGESQEGQPAKSGDTHAVERETFQTYPPYKLITEFSKKIGPETGLILYSYGINHHLPKDYQYINGLAGFSASYAQYRAEKDTISLDYARQLVVFLTEKLLQEINSNIEVRYDLDIYPFVSDLIDISLYFMDDNKIQLGQGVAKVYFYKGKIKYARFEKYEQKRPSPVSMKKEYEIYDIHEYKKLYPDKGKYFPVHEETYAEALEIVKKQGALTRF